MSSRRSILATLDSVHIERDGEQAVIYYHDPLLPPMQISIGPSIHRMSDQDILDRHNFVLALQKLADRESLLVEIPPGSPQVSYDDGLDRWVPRGEVLRCLISDESFTGRPTIGIDGQDLSLAQFGDLLTTYAGGGMRITFVPEGELLHEPRIMLCDPPEARFPDGYGGVIEFPGLRDSSIREVLKSFLDDKKRHYPVTFFSKLQRLISLLMQYMNEQGYTVLDGGERALLNRDQLEAEVRFSDVFGSDKIVQVMDGFLKDLVRRRFHGQVPLRRASSTVMRQLLSWLVENEYISEETGHRGIQHCGEALHLLQCIDSTFDLLTGAVEQVCESDSLLDGQYCLARVDHGIIWLTCLGSDRPPVPVAVDPGISQNLEEEAWVLDCTLTHTEGRWVIAELKDVYPL